MSIDDLETAHNGITMNGVSDAIFGAKIRCDKDDLWSSTDRSVLGLHANRIAVTQSLEHI